MTELWCHVMAHESFEDDDMAAVLNRDFVPVKVDREERPDVDSVYMDAVQAMTGRGGWPMSVFCTPDGVPFFAGTYWPPHDRQGMPGFRKVLAAVSQAWNEQHDEVVATGERLVAHLEQARALLGDSAGSVDPRLADQAAEGCVAAYDGRDGGFGRAPKFPHAMTIDFLLAHSLRVEQADPERAARARDAAIGSLQHMARGGIRDQVGGGFHRYSVDAVWLVPHFEKMLYDNALLLRAYLHGWQVTADESLRSVVDDIATYLLSEMRHAEGGFYSATDADSEGVEGRYFTWSAAEFDEVVRSVGEDPATWRAALGVTDEGNFADPHHPELPATNILHQVAELPPAWTTVRAALAERRAQRVPPGLDDKVLTSWNSLAIGALAEAGAACGQPEWIDGAARAAGFVLRNPLQHSWHERKGWSVAAFLEDVSYLAQALIVLFEATGETRWLEAARRLAAQAESDFADGETGTYFATAHQAETLLTRPKDVWDNATPAGSSVMVDVNLRLAALTGDAACRARAERTIAAFQETALQAPTGFGELLRGVERLLGRAHEVAIVGAPGDPRTRALVAGYRSRWRPASVLAVGSGEGHDDSVPLLAGRGLLDDAPAAYVCHDFVCERPVTTADELAAKLA